MKLLTVQNEQCLSSTTQNKYYENHHFNSKSNYSHCTCSIVMKVWK